MLALPLPEFPTLQTPRILLRELVATDAPALFDLRSDPEVMKLVSRPLMTRPEEADALVELIRANQANGTSIHWAMAIHGQPALIGLIGYWRMQPEHHKAELGYMLARSHWGKGLISEAIHAVVRCGFDTLRMHRVEAIIAPANHASRRVLEKNGFIQEGHFNEDHLWQGRFEDSVHFGRITDVAYN
jgi:ribosomal-protein-alanine N-acetyltransferase